MKGDSFFPSFGVLVGHFSNFFKIFQKDKFTFYAGSRLQYAAHKLNGSVVGRTPQAYLFRLEQLLKRFKAELLLWDELIYDLYLIVVQDMDFGYLFEESGCFSE